MRILLTILLVLLGYYLLGFLWRLLLPRLRNYALSRTEKYFQEAFSNSGFQQPDQAPEGEISIDKRPSREMRDRKPVGEYIEFEEIE